MPGNVLGIDNSLLVIILFILTIYTLKWWHTNDSMVRIDGLGTI